MLGENGDFCANHRRMAKVIYAYQHWFSNNYVAEANVSIKGTYIRQCNNYCCFDVVLSGNVSFICISRSITLIRLKPPAWLFFFPLVYRNVTNPHVATLGLKKIRLGGTFLYILEHYLKLWFSLIREYKDLFLPRQGDSISSHNIHSEFLVNELPTSKLFTHNRCEIQ